MEPIAGERLEVDWGHFGALDYAGDQRKLYAFALVECQIGGEFVLAALGAAAPLAHLGRAHGLLRMESGWVEMPLAETAAPLVHPSRIKAEAVGSVPGWILVDGFRN